jgi:hypothetical protein
MAATSAATLRGGPGCLEAGGPEGVGHPAPVGHVRGDLEPVELHQLERLARRWLRFAVSQDLHHRFPGPARQIRVQVRDPALEHPPYQQVANALRAAILTRKFAPARNSRQETNSPSATALPG